MGTEIPHNQWVIDPATWYWVLVYTWEPPPLAPACGGLIRAIAAGARLGQVIINWLNADDECTFNTLIRPPDSGVTERILSITPL